MSGRINRADGLMTVMAMFALSKQPLAGIPFLVLVATGVACVFVAFTALPKTMAAAAAVRDPSGRAAR